MIPSGYKVIRVGWVREPIGYEPMPEPGHPGYKPATTPETVYSDPKRWIEIDTFDSTYDKSINLIQIFDDGSKEFDKWYNWFLEDDLRQAKAMHEQLERGDWGI